MSEKLQKELRAMSNEKFEAFKASTERSLKEFQAITEPSEAEKSQLEATKTVMAIVNTVEKERASNSSKNEEYVPEPGTEKQVHAIIRRGAKFDAETGKPLGEEYTQYFNKGEWLAFAKNAKALGYTIIKVLYNPFEK